MDSVAWLTKDSENDDKTAEVGDDSLVDSAPKAVNLRTLDVEESRCFLKEREENEREKVTNHVSEWEIVDVTGCENIK